MMKNAHPFVRALDHAVSFFCQYLCYPRIMSRSERLLDLLNILRRKRLPVSGQALADELGVSLRTLYRDVATLQAMGCPDRGRVRGWLCAASGLSASAAVIPH